MKEQIKDDLPFWVLVAVVIVLWVALIYVMIKAPRTPRRLEGGLRGGAQTGASPPRGSDGRGEEVKEERYDYSQR